MENLINIKRILLLRYFCDLFAKRDVAYSLCYGFPNECDKCEITKSYPVARARLNKLESKYIINIKQRN